MTTPTRQEQMQILHHQHQVQNEISVLKRAALQVVAGGSAGFVEVCIMQPLDVVKTRMQLQNTLKTTGEAERIQEHGYPAESHFLETSDGYVLNIFRIPYSSKLNNKNDSKKPIVLLQHGLFSCSDSYLLNGPDNAMAYNFADAGFDVWLGNARANIYSRNNTKISLNHPYFWRFSWHEIGVIDMPETIDYILNITGENSLHYVGHSQGTTVYFVMMSSRPEYNEKIKTAHMLAPSIFEGNTTSEVVHALAPYVGTPGLGTALFSDQEFIPYNTLVQRFLDTTCGGKAKYPKACRAFFYGGSEPEENNFNKGHYKGVFDCFAKMYRQEGLFSYWKGILPPLIAETPKRAIKFVCFEQTKSLFLFGAPAPTPLTFSLAGLTAGLVEAIAVNPFEVVKVAQQADHSKMKAAAGTWAVTKQIVQKDGFGFRGLNKGVTATMCRNGLFNMVYFGFYHSVKNIVPAYDDARKEFFRKVLIGFTSGTLACFVNIPFDVAKSRIQGPQPQPGVIKYKSTLQSVGMVYREEGFRALYKGLVPKVMRLGPGGAIMLLVFEYTYEFLEAKCI